MKDEEELVLSDIENEENIEADMKISDRTIDEFLGEDTIDYEYRDKCLRLLDKWGF